MFYICNQRSKTASWKYKTKSVFDITGTRNTVSPIIHVYCLINDSISSKTMITTTHKHIYWPTLPCNEAGKSIKYRGYIKLIHTLYILKLFSREGFQDVKLFLFVCTFNNELRYYISHESALRNVLSQIVLSVYVR